MTSGKLPQPNENWKCPYCGHAQAVADARHSHAVQRLWNDDSVHERVSYVVDSVACANAECRKLSLVFGLFKQEHAGGDKYVFAGWVQRWDLLPESSARPQPEIIPAPIREDYYEACRIRDLSPKASATLSRRCLQGMIRDFCGIAKGTLNAEIEELETKVTNGHAPAGVLADTVEAIDGVRKIGNIGAHMEKDINLIVDVDPDEAQTLIELLELLFDEWYVARQQRKDKIARVGAIAEAKAKARQSSPMQGNASSAGTNQKE